MSQTTSTRVMHRRSDGHTGATRRGRLTRIAGAAAVAGLVAGGVALSAAPADAAALPQPSGNLPGCTLPAGVHWQLTNVIRRPLGPQLVIIASRWGATGAGHTYTGTVRLLIGAPDVEVAAGNGSLVTCNVR